MILDQKCGDFFTNITNKKVKDKFVADIKKSIQEIQKK